MAEVAAAGRSRGAALRLGISGLLFSLTMAGTLWGTADHFPFAPFTQYAGDVQPGEPFTTYELWSGFGSSDEVRLSLGDFGMRPAEVSRQLNHFGLTGDEVAALLVESYESRQGEGFPFHSLEVVRVSHLIGSGEVRRVGTEIAGSWEP